MGLEGLWALLNIIRLLFIFFMNLICELAPSCTTPIFRGPSWSGASMRSRRESAYQRCTKTPSVPPTIAIARKKT